MIAANDLLSVALDQLGNSKQQIAAPGHRQRWQQPRRSIASGWCDACEGANVEPCRHTTLLSRFASPRQRMAGSGEREPSPDHGSAVRMPAGPPLVLIDPTFCSDRPERPEKRMTLISSSTMHCTSRVLLFDDQTTP